MHDSHNIHFVCRAWGIAATDLNQGVVYGCNTPETALHPELATRFDYDGIWGTVLNRFIVQSAIGKPLTVYGTGGQTRGFLDIRDTMACVQLSIEHPAKPGEFRVFNQFTEQFSVLQLAELVRDARAAHGLETTIEHTANPRFEKATHYYNAKHQLLVDLGLEAHKLRSTLINSVIEVVNEHIDRVDLSQVGVSDVEWSTGRARAATGKAQVAAQQRRRWRSARGATRGRRQPDDPGPQRGREHRARSTGRHGGPGRGWPHLRDRPRRRCEPRRHRRGGARGHGRGRRGTSLSSPTGSSAATRSRSATGFGLRAERCSRSWTVTASSTRATSASCSPGSTVRTWSPGIRNRRADPWYRSFVSGVYNRVVRLSFGIRELDFDCGLKVFTRELWDAVTPIRARSAVFNPEMFFKAHRLGFRVVQVRVQHLPRLAGVRSGGRLIPVARAMRDVIRLRISLAMNWRPEGARRERA